MADGLTNFETEVLRLLLMGEDPVLVALREQLQVADVVSREVTGAGFFVNFSLPPTVIHLHAHMEVRSDFCFGDVHAEIHSIEHGAGFLLWIKNGRLSFLEGYTYDEPWPSAIQAFKLEYITDGNERNWTYLREQWKLE